MSVNIVDIICLVFLGYALYRGAKNGLLLELGSIASLLIGVWLATKYGQQCGLWLGFDNATASVGGFIVLLIAVVLFIVIMCRILRAVINLTGLGLFDKFGGAVVSVLKTAVVLSFLLGFLVPINAKNNWIEAEKIEQSKSVEYVAPLASMVFPYIEEAKDMYLESLKDGADIGFVLNTEPELESDPESEVSETESTEPQKDE